MTDSHVHYHTHHYYHPPHVEARCEVMRRLDALDPKLDLMETKIMATLDQVLADVKAENTQLDSLGAYIAGIKQQLTDALAGAKLPADVQVKVDAVFAQQEANTAKIAAAMNTTSTVPPPVTPAPTAPLTVNTDPLPPTTVTPATPVSSPAPFT